MAVVDSIGWERNRSEQIDMLRVKRLLVHGSLKASRARIAQGFSCVDRSSPLSRKPVALLGGKDSLGSERAEFTLRRSGWVGP